MQVSDQRWQPVMRTVVPSSTQRDAMGVQHPQPADNATGTPLHVVVADDSELVRTHLVALLSTLDRVQVVGEADDTIRLIELVDSLMPQVVVLDISMPGGNGIKALQHIKQVYPATLVIMLTNHSNDFYRKKCLSAGASFFFDKSCEFEKVGEVLANLAR